MSQPNNEKELTFRLCEYHYTVPEDKALYGQKVLSFIETADLISMHERIVSYENQYARDKKVLLDKFESKKAALHKKLRKKFFKSLEQNVNELQKQSETYFESVIKHCSELCQMALQRLYVDIPCETKILSVLHELVEEYSEQQEVELVLAADTSVSELEINLPRDWKISYDSSLGSYECRLKLDFGEVVGNFDDSYKALYEPITGEA